MNEKPGWKTSEFWLTIVMIVLTALLSSGVFEDVPTVAKIVSAIVATLAALGYTANRAVLKYVAITDETRRRSIEADKLKIAAQERLALMSLEEKKLDLQRLRIPN